MDLNFQTVSMVLFFLVLFSLTILPVKIGATIFGATNNELKLCAISVFIGTFLSMVCLMLIGGFLGLMASYIAVSIVYSRVLGISIMWSFLFTFGVFFIQVGVVQALTKFGIFT